MIPSGESVSPRGLGSVVIYRYPLNSARYSGLIPHARDPAPVCLYRQIVAGLIAQT